MVAIPTIVTRNDRYVQAEDFPVWHLDGVMWLDARPPFVIHRHRPQSVFRDFRYPYEVGFICACGATGGPHDRWVRADRPRVRFW